jgi:hypothetical protein
MDRDGAQHLRGSGGYGRLLSSIRLRAVVIMNSMADFPDEPGR